MATKKLPAAVEVRVWRTDRTITLGNLQSLKKWAQQEHSAWLIPEPTKAGLRRTWQQQTGGWQSILDAVNTFENQTGHDDLSQENLDAYWAEFRNASANGLSRIEQGTLLTTESLGSQRVRALGADSPDAAILALMAYRSDGDAAIAQILGRGELPWSEVIRRSFPPTDEAETSLRLQDAERQFNSIKSSAEEAVRSFETISIDAAKKENNAHGERSKSWGAWSQGVKDQWDATLRIYNEELALAAPTKYWANRAKDARAASIAYGIAFAVVLCVALAIFFWLGLRYLHDAENSTATAIVASLLPVLVPLFAVVWILRIVGRLLSESLQLVQDAREREVMVMTFLALMKDDRSGKALVTDEDRLLILHSLFRPSAVSSTDDSPPVNWFDVLLRRLGGPKQ